jgi:hypothetical protein
MNIVMSVVTPVWTWFSGLPDWILTGDRANVVYFCLASALLLELSLRVIRRFFADRRARTDAARSNQRLSTRLRRAPSA